MATTRFSETPQGDELSDDTPEVSGGDQEPSRKIKIATFVALSLCHFFYGVDYSLYGPFFPQLATVKEASLGNVGLILSIHHLSALFFTPVIGMWVQSVATKVILFIGLLIVGICTTTFGCLEWSPHHTSFISLAFSLRFLEGFGAASIRASVLAISASQFSTNWWKVFVVLEIVFSLGLVAGPIAGGALKDHGGFALPFFTFGISTVVVAILVISITKEPHVIKVKVTKKFWSVFKLAGNWIYLFSLFSTFFYSGFLEATLQPHLRQFQLNSLYIGLIFQTPAAVSSMLAYGWKWMLTNGLNSVMALFVAVVALVASMIIIAPISFTHLNSSIGLIVGAVILKGIGDSAKTICAFHGAYSDSVWERFPNTIDTHSLIFGLYLSGVMSGSAFGTASAGYIYESIGFENGLYIPMALEIITTPFLLVYAFRRLYRKPLLYSEIEERRPLIKDDSTQE